MHTFLYEIIAWIYKKKQYHLAAIRHRPKAIIFVSPLGHRIVLTFKMKKM